MLEKEAQDDRGKDNATVNLFSIPYASRPVKGFRGILEYIPDLYASVGSGWDAEYH